MIWAALAGLGAASLLLSLGTVVLRLLWSAQILTFPSAPGFTAAYVPALAVGIAVARALGGWTATIGVAALGIAAATRLLGYVDAETLFSYSAIPGGLLLGAVSSVIIGRPRVPLRQLLEAAGGFGLVGIAGALIDTAARAVPPSDPYVYGLALSLVAVLGAGVVLARRSARPVRDAALLACALFVLALMALPTLWVGGADNPRNLEGAALRLAQPLLLLGSAWIATKVGATRVTGRNPRLPAS